jgi:hypothetical protein
LHSKATSRRGLDPVNPKIFFSERSGLARKAVLVIWPPFDPLPCCVGLGGKKRTINTLPLLLEVWE